MVPSKLTGMMMEYFQRTVKLILLSTFLSFVQTSAQNSSFDYNGYAKYLFSSTEIPGINDRLYDHLLHLRLNTKYYATKSLTAAMELRFRTFYGESAYKIPNYRELIQTKRDFVQLDFYLWQTKYSIGYLEVDRLYLDFVKNNFDVTVGRQRIAWGTCWVWNPTDLFNPLEVLDFDYEERPATDAVRIQYYTGPVTKLEVSYKPAKDPYDQILAGLFSLNKWDYDFNFIGGMKYKRWLAGFSWAGDIYGAGFRGELLVSQKPDSSETIVYFTQPTQTSFSDKTITSFALSGDYTFPNSFYIHTEVLYNNIGVTANTFLYQPAAGNLGLLTAARWSLYQEFSYDITPLLRGSLFGIYNPNDKSFVVVPSLSYSVITNLDLYLIAFFFEGNPLTEYGEYGITSYIRIKYSF
jgi:hypothetical protein